MLLGYHILRFHFTAKYVSSALSGKIKNLKCRADCLFTRLILFQNTADFFRHGVVVKCKMLASQNSVELNKFKQIDNGTVIVMNWLNTNSNGGLFDDLKCLKLLF